MKKSYYVNEHAQDNGDHEVHEENCFWLPYIKTKKYLGEFTDCGPAVKEAKRYFIHSNGCRTCSITCHTQ